MGASVRLHLCGLLAAGLLVSHAAMAQGPPAELRQAGELVLHQPVERELGPGQADIFTVNVAAGQFLYVAVEKKGVDATVVLADPEDNVVVTADSPNGIYGYVPASVLAERDGTYKVRVIKSARNADKGTYRIELAELQSPTEEDRTRLQAEEQFFAAAGDERGPDRQKRLQSAEQYQRAGELWHSISDVRGEALSLQGTARVANLSGDRQKALDAYNRVQAIFHSIPDPVREADALLNIAVVYQSLGEQRKARDSYSQVLPLLSGAGDRKRAAQALNLIASIHRLFGEIQEAMDSFEQALALFRGAGDKADEATVLESLGSGYLTLGENQKALDYYTQALPLRGSPRNDTSDVLRFLNIGTAYARLGQNQKALATFDQALQAAGALSGPLATPVKRQVLNEIGQFYNNLGDEQKALDYRNQASQLAPAPVAANPAPPIPPEPLASPSSAALFKAGGEALASGDKQKAEASFNQALAQVRATENHASEASLLRSIGATYYTRGELPKALDHYDQALALYRAAENHAGEAATLGGIGSAYLLAANPQKALESFAQQLSIEQALGNRAGVATALHNMGFADWELGHLQDAVANYNQALPVERALGERPLQAKSLTYLGMVYAALGQQQNAIDYYTQAQSLFRPEDFRQGDLCRVAAMAWSGLGRAYMSLGDMSKALEDLGESLRFARQTSNPVIEGETLHLLMLYWRIRGVPGLAIFFGKESINQFQTMRRNNLGLDQDSQQDWLAYNARNYRELADLLIGQGRLSEAEQVLSLLKEQEFFEYLRRDSTEASANGSATLNPQELDADKRYHEIEDQLVALGVERGRLWAQPRLTATERERFDQIDDDIRVGNEHFVQVLNGLAQQFAAKPEGKNIISELRDEQSIMENLRELPRGTVAIYTVVGEDKFHSILRTPDVQKAYEYSIKEEDLNRKVHGFREAVQDPRIDPRPLAEELYKIIIEPMAKDLRAANAETLMFSLDGTLRYVPLAALYDGKRYLIEDYRVSVMTLASNYGLKDHPDKKWKAAGFGVTKAFEDEPALPSVPAELAGIIATKPGEKGVLAGEIKLDGNFTLETLRETLQKHYPVVHIATHFRFEPGDETKSFLLLGDGGHLSLADLRTSANLFGGVQLLTLSACNTGIGDGSEVEGFGTLAQRQGAKAVVASLWPVADESTSRLMQEFYRIRESSAGLNKVEALREAQLELLHGNGKAGAATPTRGSLAGAAADPARQDGPRFPANPKAPFAHPVYWAPFFLMGNWL